MTDRRERLCVGGCCADRPGWEWVEDPETRELVRRRQPPSPGQHGTEGHSCRPRLAADGAYLCRGCTRWLTELVASLPSYADDLERAASHSASSSSGTLRESARASEDWGRTSGGRRVPLASPDFAVMRFRVAALEQLAHDVAWWALLVSEERGLRSLPSLDTVGRPRQVVHVATGWLSGHVEWLAARASADETLSAFRCIRADAAHAMDLPRDRARFPVGPCPESSCAGTVVAFIGTERDDSALGCDVTPEHEWSPSQFYRAGVRIRRRLAEGQRS